MRQTIIFFGSGWYTIPVVKKLLDYNLSLVVTTETTGKLVEFCKQNNVPFISTHLNNPDAIERINNLNATIGVLASYGAFIPSSIINHFPSGIINIHPSLLPQYKGPSPIQYALLNGDTQTGVTLIKLDNEIDHGPILLQKPYTLTGNETSEDLLSILFEIGADMVNELVIKLEQDEVVTETEQSHSNETWSYKIEKKDGMVDFTNPPTRDKLNNMIRAFYPWPGVWFRADFKNQEKIVKLLPEDKIQVEGKNPMSFKDFLNGFGDEGKKILENLNLTN